MNFSLFEIGLIATVIFAMTQIMPKVVTWFILSRREGKRNPEVKNNNNQR